MARLELVQGDIVAEQSEAIVNAANSSLLGGGGVDGAIHRAGGPSILDECRDLRAARGSLPPGEAVITGAGHLAARYVIHTVGPVWQGGHRGEPEVLGRCYTNSLALAKAHGLTSVSFPSVSTGAYGFPVAEASRVALRAIVAGLALDTSVLLVRCVLFSPADLATYVAALDELSAARRPG